LIKEQLLFYRRLAAYKKTGLHDILKNNPSQDTGIFEKYNKK